MRILNIENENHQLKAALIEIQKGRANINEEKANLKYSKNERNLIMNTDKNDDVIHLSQTNKSAACSGNSSTNIGHNLGGTLD